MPVFIENKKNTWYKHLVTNNLYQIMKTEQEKCDLFLIKVKKDRTVIDGPDEEEFKNDKLKIKYHERFEFLYFTSQDCKKLEDPQNIREMLENNSVDQRDEKPEGTINSDFKYELKRQEIPETVKAEHGEFEEKEICVFNHHKLKIQVKYEKREPIGDTDHRNTKAYFYLDEKKMDDLDENQKSS